MMGTTFYNGLFRKYVILFGTLFNDLYINRLGADGRNMQLIKIPLSYAPKEKVLVRLQADPNISRPYAQLLPRMTFQYGAPKYDGTRKLTTITKTVIKDTDKSKMKYDYNPVPYNIPFQLNIAVKNVEDGTRIIEQILPYFTPNWTAEVLLIPDLDIRHDIVIDIKDIQLEDNYDSTFDKRDFLFWTIDFEMKVYFYGPVRTKPIIKFANTTFYIPSVPDGQLTSAINNTDPSVRVTLQPGLLANGSPTTDATLTIPYSEIEKDDDYGFAFIETDPILNE